MGIINRGTKCCKNCGRKLFEFIEYELNNGELDSDTKDFCEYTDDLCNECYEEEYQEEEEEE